MHSPLERSTLFDCFNISGFIILALRGIFAGRDRESLLNGSIALEQQGRRNINGSNVDMADSFEDG